MHLVEHLRTRPRMAIAVAVGIAAGWLVPDVARVVTRILIGWNVGVWLLLALTGVMMVEADHDHLRRNSTAQAESAPTVLAIAIVAAIFSMVAIVVELSAAKGTGGGGGGGHELPRVLFAIGTVASAWLLLPMLFAMSYASLYYVESPDAGLKFPDADADFHPDYVDFLYFAFTIAVASQTADVSITTRPMRRLVLLQSVLSFAFNTTVLALTINIAASLF